MWLGMLRLRAAVLALLVFSSISRVETACEPAEIWVEVHDVCPVYGVEALRRLSSVLLEYSGEIRVFLMVVPCHYSSRPISESPELIEEIRRLLSLGFEMCLHGYTHRGFEFAASYGRALELAEAGLRELAEAGLPRPRGFCPPRWRLSLDAAKALSRLFTRIHCRLYVIDGGKVIASRAREYTWSTPEEGVEREALADYLESRGVFRIVVHLNAGLSRERLSALSKVLSEVTKARRAMLSLGSGGLAEKNWRASGSWVQASSRLELKLPGMWTRGLLPQWPGGIPPLLLELS